MSVYGGVAYAGEAYSGVGAAAAPAATNPIEFHLYDPLNAEFVAVLSTARARRWMDPENDAGSGEMEIHADDAVATSTLTDANGRAVYGNVVRCLLNGTTRFAWMIENNTKGTAKAGEEVERVLRLAGRGTLAYFEHAVLYPERGIGRVSPDSRLFNWTSSDFDDSSWPAATELTRYDNSASGSPWNSLYGLFPRDFPDPTAFWIWGASGSPTADAPAGDVYFRRFFTLPSIQPVVMVFSTDNGMDIFLDNAHITSKSGLSGAWTQAGRVDLLLDEGEHLLAIKGHNGSLAELGIGPVLNVGGTLFAMHRNAFGGGAEMSDFGTVVFHSDSSWSVLEYPPGGPPGMTPGEVMRLMFTEAQTRGCIPGVTWTFTDANDSNGNPWDVVPDLGFEVGTTYYAALRQISEVACDLHMDPTSLRLDAFNQRGSASSATLSIGTNITDAEHQGTGDITNVVLLRFVDGWREVTSASSIVTGGRQESFLATGVAPSEEQATLAAQAIFTEQANPRDAIVVTHEGRPGSGTEPYADYDVADTLSAPTRAGTAQTQLVRAITVSEDDDGNPIFTPEVETMAQTLDDRIQRWIKRMAAGTVAGTSENASPFRPGGIGPERVDAGASLGAGGLRYATVVVAASDSLHPADADLRCDGSNDEVTINAAMALLPSGTDNGGTVLLMEGTYSIGGEIKFPSSRRIALEGLGRDETFLHLSGNVTGSVIDATSSSAAELRDFTVDGKTFSTTDNAIRFGSVTIAERVRVTNVNTQDAFQSEDGCIVVNCSATSITGNGFDLGNSEVLIAVGNTVQTVSGFGFRVDGADNEAYFAGNYVDNCEGIGVISRRGTFVGNIVTRANGNAWEHRGGAMALVADNLLEVDGAAHTVVLVGTTAGFSMFTGNTLRYNNAQATSFDLVNVTGDEMGIMNNRFVRASTATGQPRAGIRFEVGADNNVVLGNVFRNITTPITDLGAANQLAYSGGALGDNLSY